MRYDLIPEDKKEWIKQRYQANDVNALLQLHNQLKLTEYTYSCCNLDGLMKFYKQGIDTGLI